MQTKATSLRIPADLAEILRRLQRSYKEKLGFQPTQHEVMRKACQALEKDEFQQAA